MSEIEMGPNNDCVWWLICAAVLRGRNGDDPREVADEMMTAWHMTGAEVRVQMEMERERGDLS